MALIAQITVQLVHIHGPLKGEIQTFDEQEIRIGRHPECQVKFPKDLVTLSRQHARIVREGNRYKIIDESTNGTYVNGQRVTQTFLKDGDVITFADGGPKVSFLTRSGGAVSAQQDAPLSREAEPVRPSFEPPPVHKAPHERIPDIRSTAQAPRPLSGPSAMTPGPPVSAPVSSQDVPIESVKAPLAIQYGPALKSFQRLPITIGKGPGVDFSIDHPELLQRHAQFFFSQERYWIKDLTGSQTIRVNGAPIPTQAPLDPDAQILLTPKGPHFRFLGGGRLAEIEDPVPPSPRPTEPPQAPDASPAQDKKGQKSGALFKKFFR